MSDQFRKLRETATEPFDGLANLAENLMSLAVTGYFMNDKGVDWLYIVDPVPSVQATMPDPTLVPRGGESLSETVEGNDRA